MPRASMKSESAMASSRSSEPWLMKTCPAVTVIQLAPIGASMDAPTTAPIWQCRSGGRMRLVDQLHRHRRRLAAADAQGRDALPAPVGFDRAEQGRENPRAA